MIRFVLEKLKITLCYTGIWFILLLTMFLMLDKALGELLRRQKN